MFNVSILDSMITHWWVWNILSVFQPQNLLGHSHKVYHLKFSTQSIDLYSRCSLQTCNVLSVRTFRWYPCEWANACWVGVFIVGDNQCKAFIFIQSETREGNMFRHVKSEFIVWSLLETHIACVTTPNCYQLHLSPYKGNKMGYTFGFHTMGRRCVASNVVVNHTKNIEHNHHHLYNKILIVIIYEVE